MKAMEYSLTIIVTVIVILIVALVLIGIFTGAIGGFSNTFFPWADQRGKGEVCADSCRTNCINFGVPPVPYVINGEDCNVYFPCDCSKV